MFAYAYEYMHAVTINQKEDMNLKKSGEEYNGGSGERNGKREV